MCESNSSKLSGRLSSAEGRRKPKSTSVCLRRDVAVEHAAHLRDRHVRLVDEEQPVVREVVEQRPRRAAGARAARGGASSSRCRSSSPARAGTRCRSGCARRGAAPRGACPAPGSRSVLLRQLRLDVLDRRLHLVGRGHEVLRRVDVDRVHLATAPRRSAGRAPGCARPRRRRSRRGPPAPRRPGGSSGCRRGARKRPRTRFCVVALVLHVDEAAQSASCGWWSRPSLKLEDELLVLARLAETVDAGHGGHDDHVAALEEGARGGVAQLVDLLVDVRVLGDVGVGARDVGLGLVVVVVRDEVLDGVLREELAELGVELRGERLVGRRCTSVGR